MNNKGSSLLRLLLAISTVSAFSVIANTYNFENVDGLEERYQRTPASHMTSQLRSLSEIVQQKVAEDLATIKDRAVASIGKISNPLDSFRFGTLEGKYAVYMSDEKITDISFVDTPDSAGSPTRIHDRLKFLKNNAELLNIKDKIERVAIDISGRKIIETYKAQVKGTEEEVTLQVELDELDRLYSIKL